MPNVRISDIKIGHRHRKDKSDPTLFALAQSIKEQGLLQPIGITEDNELVFGFRRLQAVRLAPLWWQEIEARIVNVTSIAAGEFAENEMRKNFTVSERVAILKTIKEKIGNRQGLRTDQLPTNSREVTRYQQETDTQAARQAGFGGATTAREAVIAVRDGIPELVEAVDSGNIAINPAFIISQQPIDVQKNLILAPEENRREAVRKLRETRSSHVAKSSNQSEKMVSIHVLIEELHPLFEQVMTQAKVHQARVSQGALAMIAGKGLRLLNSWASDDPSVRRLRGRVVPFKQSAGKG